MLIVMHVIIKYKSKILKTKHINPLLYLIQIQTEIQTEICRRLLMSPLLHPPYFEVAGHNSDTLTHSNDHQSRVSKQIPSFWGLVVPLHQQDPPEAPQRPPMSHSQ